MEKMSFYIRPVCIEDAKAINEIRRMNGVMENILGIPSERYEKSATFIKEADGNSHIFVAVEASDGIERVIGMAGLHVNTSPRLRHSGGIGIMVHKDYHRQGVGKALMEKLLDVADNWLMLKRVELGVFVDNEGAIKLYEKCGFVKEGHKRCVAIRNGVYADEYIMGRIK